MPSSSCPHTSLGMGSSACSLVTQRHARGQVELGDLTRVPEHSWWPGPTRTRGAAGRGGANIAATFVLRKKRRTAVSRRVASPCPSRHTQTSGPEHNRAEPSRATRNEPSAIAIAEVGNSLLECDKLLAARCYPVWVWTGHQVRPGPTRSNRW